MNHGVTADLTTKTVFRCALILFTVVLGGTCGFMLIEPWGFWQSLYFTMITITTVGYGDEGLSMPGKQFATVLLLFGIASTTYSLSTLVRIAVQCQMAWKQQMKKQIAELNDHYIICGFGRIGMTVCQQLSDAGVTFVVIESDDEAAEDAIELGYLVLTGNSTDDALLLEAGVEVARGVICVINSDAENVFITLSVRELNPRAFIASRSNSANAERRMRRAGANLVISPYTTAGLTIAGAVLDESPKHEPAIAGQDA